MPVLPLLVADDGALGAQGGGIGEQGVDIGIAAAEALVPAAASLGHGLECAAFQRRQDHLPVAGAQQLPLGIGQRFGLRRADAQHGDAIALPAQVPGGIARLVAIDAVGQQQDLAVVQSCLFQQFTGLLQAEVGAAALHRHQVRVEGLEQGADGVHVAGQRGDGEGVTGEHHQGGLAFFVAGEDVLDLETRPRQPRGLQIAVEHGARQVEHDDPRRAGLEQGPRLFFPHRVGQRQGGDQPAQAQQS